MPDQFLDETTLAAFRRRTDLIAGDGLQALADGRAQAAELSQRAVEARAESEHQISVLVERRRAESAVGD